MVNSSGIYKRGKPKLNTSNAISLRKYVKGRNLSGMQKRGKPKWNTSNTISLREYVKGGKTNRNKIKGVNPNGIHQTQ